MKKYVAAFLLSIVSLTLLVACSGAVNDLAPYLIMVDGSLYISYSSGENPPEEYELPDGTIQSAVPGNRIPTENDQTNIETLVGCPYLIMDEGIWVLFEEKWFLFEMWEAESE